MRFTVRVCLLITAVRCIVSPVGAAEVWGFDADTGTWLRPPDGAVLSDAGEAITVLASLDRSTQVVGTRDEGGNIGIWEVSPTSPEPSLLGTLPGGPSIALCALQTDAGLWVGTDNGLYLRSGDQWEERRVVKFRRYNPYAATHEMVRQIADYPIERVVALWPFPSGKIGMAVERADDGSGGGVFALTPSPEGLSDVHVRELLRGRVTTGIVAQDGESNFYQAAPNLLIHGVFRKSTTHAFEAAGAQSENGEPLGPQHRPLGVPSLLFFDREEQLWAVRRQAGGNVLLRREPEYWVIDEVGTTLLADEGRLPVAKDLDGVLLLGTERGKLFVFDGQAWDRSELTDEIAARFGEGDLPALSPAWTDDGGSGSPPAAP